MLCAFVEEVRRIVVVDEELQRNAEFLAVIEDASVVVRDPPWAGVEVLVVVERTHLPLAAFARFGVLTAAPDSPADAADTLARLEHAIVVTELAELIANRQPGQAGAEYDDAIVFGPAGQDRAARNLLGEEVP